jgi:nucleotide-binding universal stress UspA family protein
MSKSSTWGSPRVADGNPLKRSSPTRGANAGCKSAGVEHEVQEMARGLSPGEDIVIFAQENSIDQIFVGIEKKSRTRKLLLGSTAQYIILKAACPVTTIK